MSLALAVAALYVMRVEVDGHHRGGPPFKPWVARIAGTCPKYGLARDFIKPMNDYANASVAWSGRVYGKVATFSLREGHLYEVARSAGRSSKRYVKRAFYWISAGVKEEISPETALAIADETRALPAVTLRVREDPECTWVEEQLLDGTARRLGFVVDGDERIYRLLDGRVYDVHDVDRRGDERDRFLRVGGGRMERLDASAAFAATVGARG